MKKSTIITFIIGAGVIALSPALVFAQGGSEGSGAVAPVGLGARVETRLASSTASSSSLRERAMEQTRTAAEHQIQNRVQDMNRLMEKIGEMARVSTSTKAAITATIQSQISALTALQATIGADISTTTLRSDTKSITQDYRIYALVMPQVRILAAADRAQSVAAMLNTISTKLSSRLSALPAGTDTSAITVLLTDIAAKTADAIAQATAAINATKSLVPDNGDKTIAATNDAALKAARANLQAAQKDLKAARQDAGQAITALMKLSRANSTATTTRE